MASGPQEASLVVVLCFTLLSGTSAMSSHPRPGHLVEVQVGSCEQLETTQKDLDKTAGDVDFWATLLPVLVDSVQGDLEYIQNVVDKLQGKEVPVNFINLSPTMDKAGARPLCQLNSMVEASEFCKLLGFPIPDPFVLMFPCPGCFTSVWLLRPNCLMPNNGQSSGECVMEPPPGFQCDTISLVSCQGTAIFASPSGSSFQELSVDLPNPALGV